MLPADLAFLKTFFLFFIGKSSTDPGLFIIFFPLWLPTLLFLALNGFVWRKTQAKLAARAFPVETGSAPVADDQSATNEH